MSDLNGMIQNIISNLNAILQYQCKSVSLDALKHALRGLSNQLADAMKTKEGMRLWQHELERVVKFLGEPEYTGGDPYGGGFPELVRTPENIMREFVHAKIKLCKQDAARIFRLRDDEERQAMPTIEETQRLVRVFCVCVEELQTWKETSGLEQKYGGRRLLAYGREAVVLLQPALKYLHGMGPRPTTAQVRAIVEELEESAEFADGDRCSGEVSAIDRQGWRTQVLACVPPLKAYVERVDPQGRWIFGAAERRLMDFSYQKAMECLQSVGVVEYTSTWKAEAFVKIRSACGELRAELRAAQASEASLLAWRARLMEAKDEFQGYIDQYNGTVGSHSEYEIASHIEGQMMTCRKVITEMLRILNPEEKKYQVWFAVGDRERFLKDIGFTGFLQGRMPEIAHIRELLGRLAALG